MTKAYKFKDIVIGEEGLLKGPFGSDLKKSLYVPKGPDTYKVYLQENILKKSNIPGDHYISKEYYDKAMSRYRVKENDFIVTCDGTLGEIFQLKNITEPGIISSSLLRITLNPEIVDYDYFYYYFRCVMKPKLIRASNNSVLVHLPGIEKIRDFDIELPDLQTQIKIGHSLSLLDKKIEANQKIIETLSETAHTIYDYWFLQFEFPNEEGKPYKSSGGKMVWNEELKKEIPEGWKSTNLGKIFHIERGISYSTPELSTGGLPMINLSSFNSDGTYKSEGLKFLSNESVKRRASPYDLLMCVTQQTSIDLINDTDVIGKAIVLPDIFETGPTFSADVIRILPNQEESRFFLLSTFDSKWFHRYISGFANGTKIKHLGLNGLNDFVFLLPAKELLARHYKAVLPFYQEISLVLKENQKLISLRDVLLPLLMNGQVQIG